MDAAGAGECRRTGEVEGETGGAGVVETGVDLVGEVGTGVEGVAGDRMSPDLSWKIVGLIFVLLSKFSDSVFVLTHNKCLHFYHTFSFRPSQNKAFGIIFDELYHIVSRIASIFLIMRILDVTGCSNMPFTNSSLKEKVKYSLGKPKKISLVKTTTISMRNT